MKSRQHRQTLLALTFVSIFFALGRFILDPTSGNRSVAPFTFPSVVPLPRWHLLESHPLAEPTATRTYSYEDLLASHEYVYKRDNYQLNIQMGYVVGTLGRVHDYLRDYTSVRVLGDRLLPNLRHHEGVGYYSFFVYQGRSHLSACINPRGGSTVTKGQFLYNSYAYGLQLQSLVTWLLGKHTLPDRRCLWVDLSVPLSQAPVETTYPVLEKAWLSWYQWWSPRFPQLR